MIFRELRFMLATLGSSLKSFAWGVGLIFFFIFVSAATLMEVIILYSRDDVPIGDDVLDEYGSITTSMLTLFKCMSGGADWADKLEPLRLLNQRFTLFFVFYISAMCFGILNVLTGVICQSAHQIGRIDKDLVIQEQMARAELEQSIMTKVFEFADLNEDGMLSEGELNAFLSCPSRAARLHLMDVTEAEARSVFDMLDSSGQGKVSLAMFIDTMLRLKGAAKGCDITNIMMEQKRMMVRMAAFMCYTCDSFKTLSRALNIDPTAVNLDAYLGVDVISHMEATSRYEVTQRMISHLGSEQRRKYRRQIDESDTWDFWG